MVIVRAIDGTETEYRDANVAYMMSGLLVLKSVRGRKEKEIAVLPGEGYTMARIVEHGIVKNFVACGGTALPPKD